MTKKRKGKGKQTQPSGRSAVAVQRAWKGIQNAPDKETSTKPRNLSDRQPASQSTDTQAETGNGKQSLTNLPNALTGIRLGHRRRSEATLPTASASSIVGSREASPSTEGEYNLDSESSSETESLPVKQLSTFSPNANNIRSDTHKRLQLRLGVGETIVIIGQFDLRVRDGVVTFTGATLRKSLESLRVFVSSTHSLPFITCVSNGDGFSEGAEIEISACKTGLRKLKRISPYFGRIWNSKDKAASRGSRELENVERSFTPLYKSTDDECKRRLDLLLIPESWDTAISTVSRNGENRVPLILVCGPKSSGKSTFVRLLINRILTSDESQSQQSETQPQDGIALLDVDPGQPEFSPPGQLSLIHLRKPVFGPPFTHPNIFKSSSAEQIRAHSIAMISPNTDPDHFFICALDLLKKYRDSLSLIPLIINCPGWILGTGRELLQGLIGSSSPTDVVFLSRHEHDGLVVDCLKECSKEGRFHILPSRKPGNHPRNSTILRTMQTLSYFHLTKPQDGQLQWDPTPLTAQKPWIVRYDGRNAGIFGIMTLMELVAEEQLFTVLDGALVAVVVLENISAIPGHFQSGVAGSNNEEVPEDDDSNPTGETSNDGAERSTLNENDKNRSMTEQYIEKEHPSIHRTTAENFPYLYAGLANPPLDPSKSHCIGMALIRAIDITSHTLQLLTPIPKDVIKDLMDKKSKIVLVCGKLDPAIWAYVEDLAREVQDVKHQRRENNHGEGKSGKSAKPARKRKLGKLPWVAMVDGEAANERGKGSEIWRVRRNLAIKEQDKTNE